MGLKLLHDPFDRQDTEPCDWCVLCGGEIYEATEDCICEMCRKECDTYGTIAIRRGMGGTQKGNIIWGVCK